MTMKGLGLLVLFALLPFAASCGGADCGCDGDICVCVCGEGGACTADGRVWYCGC